MEPYCLKSVNHSEEMQTYFEKMFAEESMVDVTLLCGDGCIKAHRMVLAACSNYFKNIFSKLTPPYQYPVVIIKDMDFQDLRAIIEFIYRGQVIVPQEKLTSLLKSAENLDVRGLSDAKRDMDASHNVTTKGVKRKKRRKAKKNITSESEMTDEDEIRHDNHVEQGTGVFHQSNKNKHINEIDRCRQNTNRLPNEPEIEPAQLMEQTMFTGDISDRENSRFSGHNISSMENVMQQEHYQTGTPWNQTMASLPGTPIFAMPRQPTVSARQLSALSTKTNKKRYQCPHCYKTFTEKGNMKRHTQIHMQHRNRYLCNICSKWFAWKDNFNRHRRLAHAIEDVK